MEAKMRPEAPANPNCDYGFEPQVDKSHYSHAYVTRARWVSYWHQINEVLRVGATSLLEVGVGPGVVRDYLKAQGLEVVSVDIDSELQPDVVCSVTDLASHFAPDSFDAVLSAQVLEHLPFPFFSEALNQLSIVTRCHAILSLPNAGPAFKAAIELPVLGELKVAVKLPPTLPHRFDGEHHWEIGKRGYSYSTIYKAIERRFLVRRVFYPFENPHHLFFVLAKRPADRSER